MKKYKRMNLKEFNQIKSFTNAEVKTGQIKLLTGRSYGTILNVQKSATLEDYHKLNDEAYRKYNKKAAKSEERNMEKPIGKNIRDRFANIEAQVEKMVVILNNAIVIRCKCKEGCE